jgi:diglucosylglycerate octanoyltransferase
VKDCVIYVPTGYADGAAMPTSPPSRTWRYPYPPPPPHRARGGGARPVALPPRLTVRYLDDCLRAVRTLRPGLPAVGILPAVHHAATYGFVHTGHRPGVAAVRRWGRAAGVPLLDLPALVGEHVFAGKGNPDGMHWGWDAHAEVGAALAALVRSAATPATSRRSL